VTALRKLCLLSACFIGAPAALALALANWPGAAAAIVAVAVVACFALLPGSRSAKLTLGLVAFLLAGYACLGRSFAYLSVQSVFIGEIVLGFLLLGSLLNGALWAPFKSKLAWVLLLFAAWGAVRTVPYLPAYGASALRDAAIWGYSAFALVVAGGLLRCKPLPNVARLYAWFVPLYLAWIVLAGALRMIAPGSMPVLGAGGAPLFQMKPGDAAVHLAGIGAFLILGLHQAQPGGARSAWWREWLLWAAWLAGLLLYGTQTRGGLLSILIAVLVILFLWRRGRWIKLAILGLCGLALFVFLDLDFGFGGARMVSPRQIAVNLASVTGGDESTYDGTRQWRLQWWSRIVDYTLLGEYFWQGKGFGINLADDDGFQVTSDRSLRSPHNGPLTILARSGVPGAALWILLQGGLCAGLLGVRRRARRAGDHSQAALSVWILAYWTAFTVNSAFDVYLEGPQGGIWFWSVFGVGLALLVNSRSRYAAERAACYPLEELEETRECQWEASLTGV
jgi:hypothetical protein